MPDNGYSISDFITLWINAMMMNKLIAYFVIASLIASPVLAGGIFSRHQSRPQIVEDNEAVEHVQVNQVPPRNELLEMPLEEYFNSKFHTYTFQKYKVRPPESVWRKYARIGGTVLLGAGVANGMIPVFLEYVAENAPDYSYNMTLAMIATGTIYGAETILLNMDQEEDETGFQWKTISAVSSVLPAYYLFSVENQHHMDSGNKGWDDYYTFSATLAPFLILNQYFNLVRMGNDIYQEFSENSRHGHIGHVVDALTDKEVNMVYRHIVDKNEKIISLPRCGNNPDYHDFWLTFKAIPSILFTLPTCLPYFRMWQEYLCPLGVPAPVTYPLTAISFGTGAAVNLYLSRVLSCSDLTTLPLGIFKSIPLMVLTNAAVQDLGATSRYLLVGSASLFTIFEESARSKKAITNILKRMPSYQDTQWYRELYLKENLI